MTLREKRAAALAAAQAIVEAAKSTGNGVLTADQLTELEAKKAEIVELDASIERASKAADLIADMGKLGDVAGVKDRDGDDRPAPTLGDHFVKSVGADRIHGLGKGQVVAAPEYAGVKAASDTHVTTGSVFSPVLTELDRTIIPAVRVRPTIADLLSTGTLGPNSNAVTYFVEAGVEGGFSTVAEGGTKPFLHFLDPTTRTDALRKIAGVLTFSDEMLQDLAYIVTEINTRGLYLLSMFEEDQLLNGNGTGTNVLGILNRSGLQTQNRGTLASTLSVADAIFMANTAVTTGSGLDADAVVMHPLDYQTLRLTRDGNGQYYGGGFFQGEYGNGGILTQPPIWGLRTIVTPAIAQGTALVGAFRQAATVYRKGGIRVESTNSHASDFLSNLVRTRIEERVALAVRRPSAFVKVALAAPTA